MPAWCVVCDCCESSFPRIPAKQVVSEMYRGGVYPLQKKLLSYSYQSHLQEHTLCHLLPLPLIWCSNLHTLSLTHHTTNFKAQKQVISSNPYQSKQALEPQYGLCQGTTVSSWASSTSPTETRLDKTSHVLWSFKGCHKSPAPLFLRRLFMSKYILCLVHSFLRQSPVNPAHNYYNLGLVFKLILIMALSIWIWLIMMVPDNLSCLSPPLVHLFNLTQVDQLTKKVLHFLLLCL